MHANDYSNNNYIKSAYGPLYPCRLKDTSTP